MIFFTTSYINELIKNEYINFINKYYNDIFSYPNKYVEITEKKISQYLGGGFVKLLNSGTTALQFGLLSLGVKPGDEVILPANTYSATAISITNIGAIPVFADINLDNFTIDFNDIEKKITSKTKVIIPVHIYGYNADLNNILITAKKYNIKILEDASHAFGGEYYGRKLGTIGDIGAFSCHLSKNFGTFGNGGIFYTKNEEIFNKLKNYIFPDTKNIDVLRSGRTPANMLDMDAIVLLLKLKYIDYIIEKNIYLYNQSLEELKNQGLIFPKIDLLNNKLHIRNLVVLAKNREYYINSGLGKQYYEINLNDNGFFSNKIDLKKTEIFFKENLGINFYFGKKIV